MKALKKRSTVGSSSADETLQELEYGRKPEEGRDKGQEKMGRMLNLFAGRGVGKKSCHVRT